MKRLLPVALMIWLAGPAVAHVSERAIVLLLPTDFYSAFGVLAVMASVVLTIVIPPRLVAVAFRREPERPHRQNQAHAMAHLPGFMIFFILIIIGFLGPRDPLSNLLPLSIFTVWWICLLVLQSLLGNIWHWLNPWTGPVSIFLPNADRRPLPARLSGWPAVIGLLLFAAYYLTDIAPDDPARLAKFATGYWVFTFAMCAWFGPSWLVKCETFTVLFSLVSDLSVLARRRFRFPGNALFQRQDTGLPLAILSVTFLAIGSFDGLNETFWWFGLLGLNPLEFAGRSSVVFENLVGLAGAIVALNITFGVIVYAGYVLAGRPGQLARVYHRLALTLIPIGVGYHLAHYLTSVMIGLQYWVEALDDPLGNGVHLLGLAGFHVTTSFLNQYDTVTAIWLTQAGAIVAGHILAVLLAHAVSLDFFGNHKKALLSQAFLAPFMVAYTIFGLWLLASPTAL